MHRLVKDKKVGFYHLHRHKLLNLLKDNAIKNKVKIISNQYINKIIITKDNVRIFSNDIEYDSDILIGADGLNSISRKKLNEDYMPKYSGFCAFRTITHLMRVSINSYMNQTYFSKRILIWLHTH